MEGPIGSDSIGSEEYRKEWPMLPTHLEKFGDPGTKVSCDLLLARDQQLQLFAHLRWFVAGEKIAWIDLQISAQDGECASVKARVLQKK